MPNWALWPGFDVKRQRHVIEGVLILELAKLPNVVEKAFFVRDVPVVLHSIGQSYLLFFMILNPQLRVFFIPFKPFQDKRNILRVIKSEKFARIEALKVLL